MMLVAVVACCMLVNAVAHPICMACSLLPGEASADPIDLLPEKGASGIIMAMVPAPMHPRRAARSGASIWQVAMQPKSCKFQPQLLPD